MKFNHGEDKDLPPYSKVWAAALGGMQDGLQMSHWLFLSSWALGRCDLDPTQTQSLGRRSTRAFVLQPLLGHTISQLHKSSHREVYLLERHIGQNSPLALPTHELKNGEDTIITTTWTQGEDTQHDAQHELSHRKNTWPAPTCTQFWILHCPYYMENTITVRTLTTSWTWSQEGHSTFHHMPSHELNLVEDNKTTIT